MKTLAVVAIVSIAAIAFDRLMLRLEATGHVYWRRTKRRGSIGIALLDMQAMLEPGKRVVVEERRREMKTSEASGEPPVPEEDGSPEL